MKRIRRTRLNEQHTTSEKSTKPRVVVVGAGFAGLTVVERLSASEFEVLLIDRHNFSTFQPLLYQVATAGLNPGDVSFPIRTLLRKHPKVWFRQGELTRIERESQEIILEDGSHIPYDYLVLAFGATSNYFGVPGAPEHTHAIYTLDDALEVRNLIFQRFEQVAAHGGPKSTLTFAVVGGGATGVEMAGAVAELCEKALHTDYTNVSPGEVRVLLIEQRSRILEVFDEELSEYALTELEKRGVHIMLEHVVSEITPTTIKLKDGETIDYGLVVWAAGVKVADFVSELGLPQGRGGRITVDEDLRVTGEQAIFAIGDLSAALSKGSIVPQLAQPAIQQGKHAGEQILNLHQGKETTAFRYRDRGTMATIGRHAAVAQLRGGIDLTGGPAWLAWLLLHVLTLIGARNKLSVLLNWGWHYVSWGKGPRVILGG
jgi:NADH dehydrogenase